MRRPRSPSIGHTREPLRVGFTERAAGSLELPARAAAAAREQTLAPGVGSDQLGHRRQGSARRAIPAKPPILVTPTVERDHHGTQEPRHRRPRQITQQPGERRCDRLVAQQKVRDAARDLRRASQVRVESAGLGREPFRRRSGSQSFEQRCRHSPTRLEIDGRVGARQQRHTGEKVQAVIVPVGNAGVEDLDPGRRVDLPARRGQRAAGGTNGPPATDPGSSAQCPSMGCALESTGIRRAPKAKRKIVAAIRPIEMPHSTVDGK